jgi:hypothetical protein
MVKKNAGKKDRLFLVVGILVVVIAAVVLTNGFGSIGLATGGAVRTTASASSAPVPTIQCTTLQDGMVITTDVTSCPGEVHLKNGITIQGSGTLSCTDGTSPATRLIGERDTSLSPYFDTDARYGVRVIGGSSSSTSTINRVHGCIFENFEAGVSVGGNTTTTVSGNAFYRNVIGVRAYGSSSNNGPAVSILSNSFYGVGLGVEALNTPGLIVGVNNFFKTQNGIALRRADGAHIYSNHFYSYNSGHSVGGTGILIDDSTNGEIEVNFIKNFERNIEMGTNTGGWKIHYNSFIRKSNNTAYGIAGPHVFDFGTNNLWTEGVGGIGNYYSDHPCQGTNTITCSNAYVINTTPNPDITDPRPRRDSLVG